MSTRTSVSARTDAADRDVAVRTETRADVTPPTETPRDKNPAMADREDAARPEGAAAAGASNNTTITAEPQVVTVVLLANMGDRERAARMCLSPTALNNQALRDYVQQEIRDHQQLNDRVNQLVRSKNIIPTRSQVGDQFFQRNQDQPRADENTRDFFAREARLHQDMLTALDQQLLPNVRDTELRQLLTDGKTVVQAHLARAQQLQGTATNQPTSMNAPASSPSYSVTTQPSSSMQPSSTAQPNQPAAQPNQPATQPRASTTTEENRASARPNQPATMPTYGQPQPVGQRTPQTSPSTQPTTGAVTPNPSSQRDTLNRENKPANLSPAYGETTSVNMRPPSASVTTTPNSASASVTAPSASVTTTPGAAAAAPATNPCDVAPANSQTPGARFDMQHNMQRDPMAPARPDSARMQMRPDTTRGFDGRVRTDSSRTTTPQDTTKTRPDTTRARPTPPRP